MNRFFFVFHPSLKRNDKITELISDLMSSYCESGYLSRYGAINDSLNNDALTLKEMLLDFFFFLSYTYYFGRQGL